MNVRELIEQLQGLNPELPVHFSYDYGDHGHTPVAPVVNNVSEMRVEHSEYHRMPKLIEEDLDDDAGTSEKYNNATEAVVLS